MSIRYNFQHQVQFSWRGEAVHGADVGVEGCDVHRLEEAEAEAYANGMVIMEMDNGIDSDLHQ